MARSYNIFRNSAVTIVCQFIAIVLGFVSRKAIIASLGLPYAGASAIFTNIIGMLAFLELGIGHALTYSLYKPLASDNKEQISACIHYFTKLYHWVAIAVFSIGLIFIPFLDRIVNVEQGIQENVYILYLLTLGYTCSTYLMAAPKTLLIADQKEYIVNILYQTCHIIQVILQIIVLFVWKDYYLFLLLQIVIALFNNFLTSFFVYKRNPYLKKGGAVIDPKIKTEMIENIKSTFLYRIGTSFLNNVSSLFVGYYCGLMLLGKISLYSLILATMSNLLRKISNSFTATIGNKGAAESIESSRATFFRSHFLISWIGFFFFGGYLLFSDVAVSLLFGQDCTIDYSLMLVLGILTLVGDVHSISGTYRFALGFFKKGRLAPLFAAIANIVFSFVFYKLFGILGIYIAPIVARIIIMGGVDSYLVVGGYKGVITYFFVMLKYVIIFIILYIPFYFVLSKFGEMTLSCLIIFVTLYVILFNLLWLFVFYKNNNCKSVIASIKSIIIRR